MVEIIHNNLVQVTEVTTKKPHTWHKCRNCRKHFGLNTKRYRLRWRPGWFWNAEVCGSCFTFQLMMQPAECKTVLKKIKY